MSSTHKDYCKFKGCKVDLSKTDSLSYYCSYHMEEGIQVIEPLINSSLNLQKRIDFYLKNYWCYADIINNRLVYKGRLVEVG